MGFTRRDSFWQSLSGRLIAAADTGPLTPSSARVRNSQSGLRVRLDIGRRLAFETVENSG